jgi:hypothetical protein
VRRLADALFWLALTLWVGGLWSIGYLVAPTLFSTLADRQIAGAIAGRLFALIGWIGIGSAAYVLLHQSLQWRAGVFRRGVFWLTLLLLVLTLAGQFGVQPLIAQLKAEMLAGVAREAVAGVESAAQLLLKDRFATWHGVASALYLVQSLLGAALVVVAGRGAR